MEDCLAQLLLSMVCLYVFVCFHQGATMGLCMTMQTKERCSNFLKKSVGIALGSAALQGPSQEFNRWFRYAMHIHALYVKRTQIYHIRIDGAHRFSMYVYIYRCQKWLLPKVVVRQICDPYVAGHERCCADVTSAHDWTD